MPICCACKLPKDTNEFAVRKNGKTIICKLCNAEKCKEWRKKNPNYWKKINGAVGSEVRTKYYDKRQRRFIKTHVHFLKHLLHRSSKPNGHRTRLRKVHVNLDYILSIWDKQNGRCAITNLPMQYERNNPESVSIDRIDSSLEYVEGNIQLVCRFVNLAKSHHPNEKIKDLFQRAAKAITDVQLIS